jgi:hypothetical protein
MTFGVSGVFVFQGIKLRVIKQIPYGWVLNSMGFHYTVHQTNCNLDFISFINNEKNSRFTIDIIQIFL